MRGRGNDASEAQDYAGVKAMMFLPSGRIIWTVVGKDSEYWVDPELPFCSCKDFYFTSLSGGDPCYHLKSVKEVQGKNGGGSNGYVLTEFRDEEYTPVLKAIVADAERLLRY
ncbi:MAG TPA: SWIM zinc finger family protein [Nitrososphaera sp.]|nr:SWIM zinc finger family protein [Nitrososphaera sp.]